MHPSENVFRIWEHEGHGSEEITMKRIKKYDLPDMSDKEHFFSTVHTAMSTENNEALIFVD